MGYYFHLIADIEWQKLHNKNKENPSYKEELDRDTSFIWIIKKDWYSLDFKYLRDNPNSIFFKEFIEIKDINDYLDYFPSEAFNKQKEYIIDFYLDSKPIIDRKYIYLTEEEMDEYIINTTKVIERIVEEKKISILEDCME